MSFSGCPDRGSCNRSPGWETEPLLGVQRLVVPVLRLWAHPAASLYPCAAKTRQSLPAWVPGQGPHLSTHPPTCPGSVLSGRHLPWYPPHLSLGWGWEAPLAPNLTYSTKHLIAVSNKGHHQCMYSPLEMPSHISLSSPEGRKSPFSESSLEKHWLQPQRQAQDPPDIQRAGYQHLLVWAAATFEWAFRYLLKCSSETLDAYHVSVSCKLSCTRVIDRDAGDEQNSPRLLQKEKGRFFFLIF